MDSCKVSSCRLRSWVSCYKGASCRKKFLGLLILIALGGIGAGTIHWLTGPSLAAPTSKGQGYRDLYKKTLRLKDGSSITLVPITLSKQDLDHLSTVYQEPSCAAMMTDGKPWTEKMTQGNHRVYSYFWELFHDLQQSHAPSLNPMTLAFLVFDDKGQLLGDMGLQTERGERADEVFFNVLPAARRRGVGYVGAQYLIEFYDKYFGKKPLGANVLPHNKPSQGLVTKLGFHRLKGPDGQQKTVVISGRTYELWERWPSS